MSFTGFGPLSVLHQNGDDAAVGMSGGFGGDFGRDSKSSTSVFYVVMADVDADGTRCS